jgi:hypothetical protein
MPAATPKPSFDAQYQLLRQHLALKGLQPKTIDAYARAIPRIGLYFDHDIDALRSVDELLQSTPAKPLVDYGQTRSLQPEVLSPALATKVLDCCDLARLKHSVEPPKSAQKRTRRISIR